MATAPAPAEHEHEHERRAAGEVSPIRCAVLTVSDTRTPATDTSGPLAAKLLEASGHVVVARAIVPDEPPAIAAQLERWLADPAVAAVVSTGGTGLAPRDRTVDVVRPMLTTELESFGELFRMLSWNQVGGLALLSRAVGGMVSRPPAEGGDTFVFALPGSGKAVELAVRELIGPQLRHLVWVRRQ